MRSGEVETEVDEVNGVSVLVVLYTNSLLLKRQCKRKGFGMHVEDQVALSSVRKHSLLGRMVIVTRGAASK